MTNKKKSIKTSHGDFTLMSLDELVLQNQVSKSANYTVTVDDCIILCSTSGAAFTLTLPPAADRKGQVLFIKKVDAGTNKLTIDGNGSETIDGGATYFAIDAQYDTVVIISDGSNWYIIGKMIA